MTHISNVDKLVAVLRQRLREHSSSRGSKSVRAGQATSQRSSTVSGVEALAAIEGVDDRKLRRAFIQDVLSEHFGEKLLNEANFQQLVERVTSTLEEDAETSGAFDRAVGELRAAAR